MVKQPNRRPAWALVAASLALIASMTLWPTQSFVVTPTFCIFCGTLGGVDFVLNVILFIPFGISLRWATGRWQSAAIIGVVTTLVIETLQARLIAGRDASLGDLLANTLGTALGAWIAIEVLRWLNSSSLAARKYAGTFGILATAMVCASAWLLQPIPPRYPDWVQWTPVRPNMDVFQGRLLAVHLNERPIHSTEMLLPPQVLDTSRRLTVRALLGAPIAPTKRQAFIVRIANPTEEGFSLTQWREAVAFRTKLAAARLKLRPIRVGLADALAVSNQGTPGTTTEITATSSPEALTVSRLHPSGNTSVTLRRTIGLAWALFVPWDFALDPRWWPANAFWLGALVLPVSFFTLRSGGTARGASRRIAWWPLPVVLATLVAVPITGLGTLSIGEWCGVVAGIAAGLILERSTATSGREDLKRYQPDGTILP